MIVRMLCRVATPPHFRYYCAGCGEDFGTGERAAHQEGGKPSFEAMWCAPCAAVENRRRQFEITDQ